MTVGGVAFPGLFHAWGKQVIAGVGWELVRQTVELDGGHHAMNGAVVMFVPREKGWRIYAHRR